jgi:hypothetical protein
VGVITPCSPDGTLEMDYSPRRTLAMPGILFTVLVAMVFSPEGGHAATDFSQFVIPVNLIFYFLLFRLMFRRKRNEMD